MNKICTSIEQSKKLMELGIDRKSSEMYYWCGEDLRIGGYKAQDDQYDIPTWCLSALLKLIPPGNILLRDALKSMRKNNSVWDNIPSGWYIRGGMIVPKPNHKKSVKL